MTISIILLFKNTGTLLTCTTEHTHTHTVTFSLAQTELFQTIFRSRVNTVTFGLSEIQ